MPSDFAVVGVAQDEHSIPNKVRRVDIGRAEGHKGGRNDERFIGRVDVSGIIKRLTLGDGIFIRTRGNFDRIRRWTLQVAVFAENWHPNKRTRSFSITVRVDDGSLWQVVLEVPK